MIVGIVAISKNLAIGKGGKLPWHRSADLRFFKETTTGNAVVMGRATWLAIGKPLPNRLNIVLSRSGDFDAAPGVMKLGSPHEVVELSKYLACDVFIIGGAKTYQAFADVIGRWIVTDVPVDVPDADTFMPADFHAGFELTEIKELGEELRVRIMRRK